MILADEPTGALDLQTGSMVMDLLERVAAEMNSALIIISHDMQVAARAKQIYQISEGVLVERSHEQVHDALATRSLEVEAQ